MTEIMDDYDAGVKYAKEKACELIIEVIGEYEDILKGECLDSHDGEPELMYSIVDYRRAQANAVRFTLDWVKSGGHTDFDGERICLPW